MASRELVVVPAMKFTIRELLWLTVVVALAVGWANERNKVAAREAEARTELINRNLAVEGN